jgi:RimJ/RimL family protein N-acetyltransferase
MRHMPGGGEARAARAGAEAPRPSPASPRCGRRWATALGGGGPRDGRLLGHAGLRLLPELGGETEILYLLDSACWGRGLATEAAAAARDAGLGPLGLGQLVAYAAPENRASTRVMEKIGMRRDGPSPVRVFGLDALRYVIP